MNKFSFLSPEDYVLEYSKFLSTNRNDEVAIPMAKYMKNRFTFFGLKSVPRKELAKKFYQDNGIPSFENWQNVCEMLWEKDEREFQYIGQELVLKYKPKWTKEDLNLFTHMITNKSWWDTVDFIASTHIGTYFKKFPAMIDLIVPEWKTSQNMWLNRTAILFQLKYGAETDFDLLVEQIEHHKSSDEFFLRKAIGWSLRQYAKYNPQEVLQYVRTANLKPLSEREALKHF